MGFREASFAMVTGPGRVATVEEITPDDFEVSMSLMAENDFAMPGIMAAHPPFSPAMAMPLMNVCGAPGPNESATMANICQNSVLDLKMAEKKSSMLSSSSPHVFRSEWPRVMMGHRPVAISVTMGKLSMTFRGSRIMNTMADVSSAMSDPMFGMRRWLGQRTPSVSAGLEASGIHIVSLRISMVFGFTHTVTHSASDALCGRSVYVFTFASVVRRSVRAMLSSLM